MDRGCDQLPEMGFYALGIPAGVGAGHNNYSLGAYLIPNQIREPMDDCPADTAMDILVNEWCLKNSIDGPRNFRQEFRA